MPKNILLHIPEPCHEDWAAMKPEDKGRFCASCCKTVVDFSLMSDREVLAYLADAAGKTCGRFTADQLQRDLMPPQAKRKGWGAWGLLLIGLLLSSRSRGQNKPPRTGSHQVAPGKDSNPGKAPKRLLMGAPARMIERTVAEPLPVFTGYVTRAESTDTIPFPSHIEELPPVDVIGYGNRMLQGSAGGVAIFAGKLICRTDTRSFISRSVSDTLSFLGIGKKEFALYPNPVSRGTVIKLSLNLDKPGKYAAGLYNEAGALMQEKLLELGADPQVELFNVPASLPGGVYFVKISSPEQKTVCADTGCVMTRKAGGLSIV